MSISKFEKKKSPKTKGFYLALGVCLFAIGAAAVTTYDSFVNYGKKNESSISGQNSEPVPSQSNKNVNKEIHGVTIDEGESFNEFSNLTGEESDENNDIAVNAPKSNEEETSLIVYPCSKEIIKEFSGENPVFSKTMGDWRIHSGVDFKTEQGEKVKSITSGTVKDIYEDPLLGKTIVIEHNNGITAVYSGFGDTTFVNKDDKVDSGQEIGSVNDVPSEMLDGYHLHFATKKDDKFINPIDVLEKK